MKARIAIVFLVFAIVAIYTYYIQKNMVTFSPLKITIPKALLVLSSFIIGIALGEFALFLKKKMSNSETSKDE